MKRLDLIHSLMFNFLKPYIEENPLTYLSKQNPELLKKLDKSITLNSNKELSIDDLMEDLSTLEVPEQHEILAYIFNVLNPSYLNSNNHYFIRGCKFIDKTVEYENSQYLISYKTSEVHPLIEKYFFDVKLPFIERYDRELKIDEIIFNTPDVIIYPDLFSEDIELFSKEVAKYFLEKRIRLVVENILKTKGVQVYPFQFKILVNDVKELIKMEVFSEDLLLPKHFDYLSALVYNLLENIELFP